jgi:hypothetical protein
MKLVRLLAMCYDETYTEVCIDKHLSHTISIQHCMIEGATLLRSLLKFAFQPLVMKFKENQVNKMNGTHQLSVYADNVNILMNNIHRRNSKKTLMSRLV